MTKVPHQLTSLQLANTVSIRFELDLYFGDRFESDCHVFIFNLRCFDVGKQGGFSSIRIAVSTSRKREEDGGRIPLEVELGCLQSDEVNAKR